jgi:hypothetical protein
MGRNRGLAVKDSRVVRAPSVEIQTKSDSTIIVDLCHADKEVEVCASAPKDKVIEIANSRETMVDASDNMAANVSRESDNMAVAALHKSDYTILK